MPLVSVIIPAYNSGRYLDEAVQSVIAQTFTDWDCIVVDDGSSEDLSRVGKMDPRVRMIRQPNRGTSVARNNGILRSSGELIAFLDHDDVWRPSKLERQLALLQTGDEIGICHTATEIIDGSGAVVGSGFASRVDGYHNLLRGNTICPSSVVARRGALATGGLFVPALRGVQDYDLWLKIAGHYGFAFLDSVEVGYRMHSANVSGDPRLMTHEVTQLLREHARAARRAHDRAAVAICRSSIRSARVGWGCLAFDRARGSFRRRDLRGTLREIGTALRVAPTYTLRSLIRYALGILVRVPFRARPGRRGDPRR